MGLDADPLHSIDHDQGPIAEPRSSGHLAAEVHMARRVDQVHKVLCTCKQMRQSSVVQAPSFCELHLSTMHITDSSWC